MSQPTQDRAVEKKSDKLRGATLAVAVCGGIAAVESVRVIRELRRHGAEVFVFPTRNALRFVGLEALVWAAGRPVEQDANGSVTHLDPFDAVVVAPLTLHTMAKAATGLADTPATLVLAASIGRRARVLYVPTMHESLLAHPLYDEYRERLVRWGGRFVESPLEEGRRKMPAPETIAGELLEWWKS